MDEDDTINLQSQWLSLDHSVPSLSRTINESNAYYTRYTSSITINRISDKITISDEGVITLVSGSSTREVNIFSLLDRLETLEELVEILLENVPKKIVSNILRDKVNL